MIWVKAGGTKSENLRELEDMMKNERAIKYFFACLVLMAGGFKGTRVVGARPASLQLPSVLNEGASKAIPGQYIVVFKPEPAPIASKTGSPPQPLSLPPKIVSTFH